MFTRIFNRLLKRFDSYLPARSLIVINGDVLPERLPMRNLVLLNDGNEDWSIGFRCPCGCGRSVELLLIDEARPRWDYTLDPKGLPSLHPSVWLKSGCKSHFWIINGRVEWV